MTIETLQKELDKKDIKTKIIWFEKLPKKVYGFSYWVVFTPNTSTPILDTAPTEIVEPCEDTLVKGIVDAVAWIRWKIYSQQKEDFQ